jgi:hypothetical protein
MNSDFLKAQAGLQEIEDRAAERAKAYTRSLEEKLERYEAVLRNFHDPMGFPAAQIIGVLGEAIMTYMAKQYQEGTAADNQLENLTLYYHSIYRMLLFCEHEFYDELPTRQSCYAHRVTRRKDDPDLE